MLLTCPGCSQSFDSHEPLQSGEMELSCPHCQASMIVVTTVKAAAIQGSASGGRPRRAISPERTVLVAVEGTATKEMIQEVLQAEGYEAVLASTGKEALTVLGQSRPLVALLDVGLPEIMGFELCERIKKSERFRDTKVILVASIYDKTRYKREPDSLYGADDYIERHHIQDRLIPKIEELLGRRPEVPIEAPAPRPTPAAQKPAPVLRGMDDMLLEEATIYEPTLPATGPEPRPHVMPPPIQSVKKPPITGDPDKHEAAKRLARLILSDIALYNQRAVEDGIRNNTFHQLLKNELDEGRRLYRSRVSPDITAAADYYEQAIEEFIRKRKGSS